MSNPDKPFVLRHAVPSGVVATRWWWVRHAPVREDNGCIYGQKDLGCDTSDHVVFAAVGKILPREAVWYASNLKRTHQTADAIWSAGFPKPAKLRHEADLAEQHLGEWQGLNRAAFFASRPIEGGSYWFAPIDDPAPGGESFMDLYNRVRGAIERTLGNQPEKGRASTIDKCSVTRLDHLASEGHQGWRIPMVNQQPWIADASHNAMHQPAGPEIATASKLA